MAGDAMGSAALGVVIIGRNEGERLERCLDSTVSAQTTVLYVDSGSTDESVAAARQRGAIPLELDRDVPFTAARARNAGFDRLLAVSPGVEYVQFIDGDCELAQGWLERAVSTLRAAPQLAVVCGRRRERFPQASPYNALCDMEWNTPVGPADECGGDAMIRVTAFRQVGGYDASLIAGEEPEMCLRLRRAGWRIERIDAEMTLHDAAMTRFSQWWKRSLRAGHAYAESAALHGAEPEKFRVRTVRSIWVWGATMPVLALAFAWPTRGLSVALWAMAVARLVYKVRRTMVQRGFSREDSLRYALFVAAGKIPEAVGQFRYWIGRRTGIRQKVIEYKA